MKLAVLSDIHGNYAALRAVLDDMANLGVQKAVNLGDYLSGPLEAKKTADLLMTLDYPSIRGNHDRLLVNQDPAHMGLSDKFAYEQLSPTHLQWLSSLSPTLALEDSIFMCHGTPTDDEEYWLEHVKAQGDVYASSKDRIEQLALGIKASLILCGHTHLPRCLRLSDGRIIVNPGSIGCPAYESDYPLFHVMQSHSTNANYAIAEKSPSGWQITFRSVPYDNEAMARLAARNGRDSWARALSAGHLA